MATKSEENVIHFSVTHSMPAGDFLWLDTYAKHEGYDGAKDLLREQAKAFIKETKPMV